MSNLLAIIPIPMPIHHSSGGKIDEQDVKVFIGCLIILSIIFVITTIATILKWNRKKQDYYYSSLLEYYFYDIGILGMFHIIMIFIYALMVLVYLGHKISLLL